MGLRTESEAITQIDRDNLDQECVRLPSDYRRWAFLSSEAKRDVAEAKAEVEVVEASLAHKIRSSPGNFGIEGKLTESAIKAVILKSPEYREAQKALNRTQYKADLCQSVVWSLEHKKRSLTNLVALAGLGWFAEVKGTREGKAAILKEGNDRLNKRLRKNYEQKSK